MKEKIIVTSAFKDFSNFIKIPETRKNVISQALNTPLRKNYAVNGNANFLHPDTQNLKIKEVFDVGRDERCYLLVPDSSKGTGKLAFFRPGQYLSFTLKIGNAVLTRPFTICSSPYNSSDSDFYMVTVKKKMHGFASDYIFNNWQKGTEVTASAPLGNFYHQPIRDFNFVLGICDNDGISSFISMARAIKEGSLNIKLTLFYTCRKKSDAIFFNELSEIANSTEKFNIIFIFSDEKVQNFERGFITKQLIEKYAPNEKFSVFIHGSEQLLSLLSTVVASLGLERKNIRVYNNKENKSVKEFSNFPQEFSGKQFECKIKKDGKTFAVIPCAFEEPILVSLERAGIETPSHCRNGSCGFCRAKLLKGNVFIPESFDERKLSDIKHNIIHPCSSFPVSDITLSIN